MFCCSRVLGCAHSTVYAAAVGVIWINYQLQGLKSDCSSSVCVSEKIFVSLTVHLSITLANDQLDAQIFNTFITILYMFRAISCSSSGGQIVLIQHLVLSLSLSDSPVHRLRKNCKEILSLPVEKGWERTGKQLFLNLRTGRSLIESGNTRCCINTIWPPEDEQDIAWNMHM